MGKDRPWLEERMLDRDWQCPTRPAAGGSRQAEEPHTAWDRQPFLDARQMPRPIICSLFDPPSLPPPRSRLQVSKSKNRVLVPSRFHGHRVHCQKSKDRPRLPPQCPCQRAIRSSPAAVALEPGWHSRRKLVVDARWSVWRAFACWILEAVIGRGRRGR